MNLINKLTKEYDDNYNHQKIKYNHHQLKTYIICMYVHILAKTDNVTILSNFLNYIEK